MIVPKLLRPTARTIGQLSRAQVEKIREDIYTRDDHQCICARSAWAIKWPCWGILTIQHAMGKGMGGSALFDGPELLRTMCLGHNNLLESNAPFARAGLLLGWSLKRNRKDITPSDVPVRYPDGHDYRLFGNFGRALVIPADAAEWRFTFYGEAVT